VIRQLDGQNVLLTGGTGSFGRAFIPAAVAHGAHHVVAYSRHEYEMWKLERDFQAYPQLRTYLGDIRDRERLGQVMNEHNVSVVIHAAALKRIEQCQKHPFEAMETNCIGTRNVLRASINSKVRHFVLLSTDKAMAPLNVYGASKAMAEQMTLACNANNTKCKFSVARYGNIWGSRGSVVHIWREAMAAEQPIRINNQDATRFFMRIGEAVGLVIQVIERMHRGWYGILTPRLPAYKIGDLAVAMDYNKLQVCPLPEHEKLHETMDGQLFSNQVPLLSIDELRAHIKVLT